ncbi:hypothetical protein [Clostridium thermosuccinogenes]|uniref:hypothetical protein n=1 Tax=Clostridium thermosuccinogenes TaxID=84032 RepID=UPI00125EC65D|nr:hypothetical protein [Pseudoclostridium thermosuccinogenes]
MYAVVVYYRSIIRRRLRVCLKDMVDKYGSINLKDSYNEAVSALSLAGTAFWICMSPSFGNLLRCYKLSR